MSNPGDFVIENGVLKWYDGPGGDVVIPIFEHGVLTKYVGPGGDVTIPAGVTRIGDWAFWGCSSLTSVTIPEGVTRIGDWAFSDCSSLTGVSIPYSVTSIGHSAFKNCSSLTSVTILSSKTSIGSYAFSGCGSLTNVTILAGVTGIEEGAFSGCEKLCSIIVLGPKCSLGKEPFGNKFPAGLVGQIGTLLPHLTDGALRHYLLNEKTWAELAPELRTEIFLSRQSKTLTPGYMRCISKEQLAPLGAAIAARLNSAKPSAKDCAAAAAFMTMFSTEVPENMLQELYAALQTLKPAAKALKIVEEDLVLKEKLGRKLTADDALPPAEKKVREALTAEKRPQTDLEAKLKSFYSLTFNDLPPIRARSGSDAAPWVLAWLLTAHERLENSKRGKLEVTADYARPGTRPEAAGVLAELDAESVQTALLVLADTYLVAGNGTKKKYLAFPICRYASEALMEELTKRAPGWRSSLSGNNAPPLRQFRQASAYNNTRAAMLFAERYHELGRYAELRGMSEDTFRDTILSELDLDKDGKKRYDLGNTTVEVTLLDDLTVGLYDLGEGKAVKSIPKENADPAKYEVAKADCDGIKKNAKKIANARHSALFAAFLKGKAFKAEDWKTVHETNPLLNRVARLLVWAQGKKTFTLTADGPVDSLGKPYAVTDKPVKVAHPMEMKPAEIGAWQMYFTSRGLKQPFAQVWEPVIDPTVINEDRYSGAVLPLYRFVGKEKHGITAEGFHAYSEDYSICFTDCGLELSGMEGHLFPNAGRDSEVTLGRFTFKKYTRYTNHIVGLLDKWTVEDRVKKDDVSVMEYMPGFTLAQITEFIAAAQKANAVNVLALLLDYKNANFADFDPMEEFTLEW